MLSTVLIVAVVLCSLALVVALTFLFVARMLAHQVHARRALERGAPSPSHVESAFYYEESHGAASPSSPPPPPPSSHFDAHYASAPTFMHYQQPPPCFDASSLPPPALYASPHERQRLSAFYYQPPPPMYQPRVPLYDNPSSVHLPPPSHNYDGR